MITEPTLIFADEPTGALDSKAATNLLEGLSQAKDVRDSTIMMVTHDALQPVTAKELCLLKMAKFSLKSTEGQVLENNFSRRY